MTPVTIDYETFWSTEFSLSKVSFIEYIKSPEFEVISVSVKIGNADTVVRFGSEVAPYLQSIDWSDKACIAHNGNEFDFPVLVWVHDCHPALFIDTLCLARPKHQSEVGGSLKKLSEAYSLPAKDSTVLNKTKGKRYADFDLAEMAEMAQYNKTDTDNTYQLYKRLGKDTPPKEFLLMDMTARMICYPQFVADTELLDTTLVEAERLKEQQLEGLTSVLNVLDVEEVRVLLASSNKFAEVLRSLGVDPPMKISKTTGLPALALAKTDEEFTALLEHEDERVQVVTAARLGVKSTLLETRLHKMSTCAKLMGGWMPVPLGYHSATTGRWGGRIWNPQNLPRINPKVTKLSDALRMSLCAPEGSLIVVSDLSGIELRVNHYLWDVASTRELYAADPEADLYKYFASSLFGVPESSVTKDQRQMGKLCLAKGTLILTRKQTKTEWVPIEAFTPDRQLWDGKEWVWAKGVASNGWKQTQSLCGVWLTPEHLVLSGTQWLQAKYVQGERISQALATGAANLSLLEFLRSTVGGSPRLSLNAIAGFLSTRLRQTTSRTSKQLAAILAPRKLLVGGGTGSTLQPCPKTTIAAGCSTGYQRHLIGATRQPTQDTATTGGAVFASAKNGLWTVRRSFATVARYMAGIFRRSRWTASIATAITRQEIYGSSAVETTCLTSAKYQSYNNESQPLKRRLPVYDILNSGPRNCFAVLTVRGPMIVHNCHLGLGFGAGAATFKKVAKLMGGIDLPDEEALRVTQAWRMKYQDIVQGWKQCQRLISAVYGATDFSPDPRGLVRAGNDCVVLPSGRKLYYPGLHTTVDETGKVQYKYGSGRNLSKVYSGLMDENLVQAVARDVIAEQALTIRDLTGRTPALSVHDELVYVVPEAEAAAHLQVINSVMRTPPTWLPGIVLWSEGDIATNYGSAK